MRGSSEEVGHSALYDKPAGHVYDSAPAGFVVGQASSAALPNTTCAPARKELVHER